MLIHSPRSSLEPVRAALPPRGVALSTDGGRFCAVGQDRTAAKAGGDGWRVVRLIAVPAGIATEVDRLEAAGINVRVLLGLERGEIRAYPELIAASLSGRAG